jgi:anaerobic magnesium-protoporphyrin IX monomethyl ester cyclase
MKLTFIRPPAGGLLDRSGSRYNRVWPPLDLLNCSAIARRAGAETVMLDLMVRASSMDEIRETAAGSDYTFITTAAIDRWQCPVPDLQDEFAFIRDIGSENIYITGTHGSIYPEWIIEQTDAAGVIRNEPENFIRELCGSTSVNHIPGGIAVNGIPGGIAVNGIPGGIAVNGIPGLSYRQNGRFIHNPDPEPVDLTTLPLPDYDAVDVRDYSYALLGNKTVLLETTRGCSFSCTFCLKKMYGKGVREKSFEQVTEEIEYVVNRCMAGSLYFIDLEFTLKKKMARHVCRVMQGLSKKIPWCCQTRADLVDPELLGEMAAAGCTLIHYGVESGNQAILDSTRKKTDLNTIEAAIRSTRKAGIASACFFLFGFPGETEQDMADTLAFAKFLNPDYASFHIVTPYPETPLAQFALSDDRFPQYCETGLSPDKLEKLVRRAYMAYYIRLKYMIIAFLRNKPSMWLRQFRLFKEFLKR